MSKHVGEEEKTVWPIQRVSQIFKGAKCDEDFMFPLYDITSNQTDKAFRSIYVRTAVVGSKCIMKTFVIKEAPKWLSDF